MGKHPLGGAPQTLPCKQFPTLLMASKVLSHFHCVTAESPFSLASVFLSVKWLLDKAFLQALLKQNILELWGYKKAPASPTQGLRGSRLLSPLGSSWARVSRPL